MRFKNLLLNHIGVLSVILTLTGIMSCTASNEKDYEDRLNRLESENQRLRDILDSGVIREVDNIKESEKVRQAKYVFGVLKIELSELIPSNELDYSASPPIMRRNVKKYYVSEVKQFDYFDETLKFEFLDNLQASFLNSSTARLSDGKIIERICLEFDDYVTASKEREKYTLYKK